MSKRDYLKHLGFTTTNNNQMSNLSKATARRIKKDASKWSENQYGHDDVNKDYLEGALHEAGRAQGLVDALEWIKTYGPCDSLTVKFIDNALAKYKEVGNV